MVAKSLPSLFPSFSKIFLLLFLFKPHSSFFFSSTSTLFPFKKNSSVCSQSSTYEQAASTKGVAFVSHCFHPGPHPPLIIFLAYCCCSYLPPFIVCCSHLHIHIFNNIHYLKKSFRESQIFFWETSPKSVYYDRKLHVALISVHQRQWG